MGSCHLGRTYFRSGYGFQENSYRLRSKGTFVSQAKILRARGPANTYVLHAVKRLAAERERELCSTAMTILS